MHVPKGRPVHEGLGTSYVNVAALLTDLEANGFTGYVFVGFQAYEAYVLIDSGSIIGAIEQAGSETRTGTEAIRGLLARAEQPGGIVSIYAHPSAVTQAIAGIIDSQVVYDALSSEFTDLDKLVGKLRREKDAVWYVEVAVSGENGNGIIYIAGGEPNGVYSPAGGETVLGAAAIGAMSEAAESLGATYTVYSLPVSYDVAPVVEPVVEPARPQAVVSEPASLGVVPAAAVAREAEADETVAPLVRLMGDVVATIEHTVAARDGVGSFAIELRAGQLEVAEHYPFLDPFAAEFEYHAGEIAFVGNVAPEEFAVGVGEALHVAVAALARRDGFEGEKLRRRIAEALGELYHARQDEFDAFGLGGLINYIAEPEAQAAEAGAAETA